MPERQKHYAMTSTVSLISKSFMKEFEVEKKEQFKRINGIILFDAKKSSGKKISAAVLLRYSSFMSWNIILEIERYK